MKRAIEIADIRKGDRVVGISDGMETTFTVHHNEVESGRVYADDGAGSYSPDAFLYGHSNKFFLLDRPEPAVVLPTSPTLGWVTVPYSGVSLGEWSVDGHYLKRDGSYRVCEDVTAFTPATAVPTEALDALRTDRLKVAQFLAAVDEANGSQS